MNSNLKERIHKRQDSLKKTCEALLANHSHIVLEIGCGHGHFLNAYAQAFPSTFCAGIDFNQERITSAQKKQAKANLSNLVFLKAEANEFLHALPPSITLDAIFLLFLDPWPKTRHHKKRLIQPTFLDLLAKKATPSLPYIKGSPEPYNVAASAVALAKADQHKSATSPLPSCQLYFKTDHLEYFNWTLKMINNHPYWNIDPNATWPLPTQTHFEKMFEHNQSLIASYVYTHYT